MGKKGKTPFTVIAVVPRGSIEDALASQKRHWHLSLELDQKTPSIALTVNSSTISKKSWPSMMQLHSNWHC